MTSTPTRTYDASGRQAAAEERRRHVVDTAHRLFVTEGYGPTSIARIAEEAGVSAPTVYAVFGSKAGLLSAVAGVAVAGDHEEGLVRDREELTTVRTATTGAEWVEMGAHYTRVVQERSAAVLHLVTSVAGADPAVAELLDQLNAGRRADLELAFTFLPGMRADVSTQDVVNVVDAMTHWETWWTLVEVGGWTPDRYQEWLAEIMARWLLADS
jgi:AcrR family transcriptional regulator